MTDTSLHDLPERFFKGQDRLKGPLPPELLAPGYQADIAGFPPLSVADGRVTHLRAIFDRFGLLQQLGVIPG